MPVTRRKSCAQCRIAKSRCSLGPVCSRCADRDLPCDYVRVSSRRSIQRQHSPVAAALGSLDPGFPMSSPSAGVSWPVHELGSNSVSRAARRNEENHSSLLDPNGNQAEADTDAFLEDALALPLFDAVEPTGCSSGEPYLPGSQLDMWDPSVNMIGTIPQVVATNGDGAIPTNIIIPSNGIGPPCVTRAHDVLPVGRASEDRTGKEFAVSGGFDSEILTQKRMTNPQSYLMMHILLGRIASYPLMLTQEVLPPFIYPQCVKNGRLRESCLRDGMHQCMSEPLAICAGMVRMFDQRTAQNRSFVWETIVKEHRRLFDEHHTYDREQLLAANQAMVVYVLLQAQESIHIPQSEVRFMTISLGKALTRLHQICDINMDIYKSISQLPYHEWVFQESAIRIANMIYVIETLMNVIFGDRGSAGCRGFSQTPLPCQYALWDYHTSVESWHHRLRQFLAASNHNIPSTGPNGCSLRIGDLWQFSRRQQSRSANDCDDAVLMDDEMMAPVARWCGRLDEFGMLVWMASTLH